MDPKSLPRRRPGAVPLVRVQGAKLLGRVRGEALTFLLQVTGLPRPPGAVLCAEPCHDHVGAGVFTRLLSLAAQALSCGAPYCDGLCRWRRGLGIQWSVFQQDPNSM